MHSLVCRHKQTVNAQLLYYHRILQNSRDILMIFIKISLNRTGNICYNLLVMFGLSFFVTSLALGIGLAMDAFSVSLADSLREPEMSGGRKAVIAGTFGLFQFLMPVIGWFFVHELVSLINVLTRFTPWISLFLLVYLGIGMIREKEETSEGTARKIGAGELIVQGIATSIDALSVGFTIANHTPQMALTSGLIIGITTFALCMGALHTGHLFKGKFKVKETTIGGIILIIIGIKVFIDGVIL